LLYLVAGGIKSLEKNHSMKSLFINNSLIRSAFLHVPGDKSNGGPHLPPPAKGLVLRQALSMACTGWRCG